METGYLTKITQEINAHAKLCDLGELQKIRKEVLGLKRLASQEKINDQWGQTRLILRVKTE